MKKLALSIISLAGIVSLTGCGGEVVYEKVEVEEKHIPTKLYVDEPGFVLFVGDTAQIHVNIRPLIASDSVICYESTNPYIASVDENGLITATGAGTAYVKVYSKENPELFEYVTVGVEYNHVTAGESTKEEKIERLNQIKEVSNSLAVQKTVQTNNFITVDSESKEVINMDEVCVRSGLTDVVYKNGVMKSSSSARQDLTVSASKAFCAFEFNESEIRVEGGNPSMESSNYYFFCNEDFDAHVYKGGDSSGNRAVVYVSGFDSRIEVVYSMLDNIFISGREIATNRFSDALERSSLTSASGCLKGGYSGGGAISAAYYKEDDSLFPHRTKGEDEIDLEIPAGVWLEQSGVKAYHWSNGRIDASYQQFVLKYTYEGDEYVNVQTSYNSIAVNDEVKIVYPEAKKYTKVDTFIEVF